MKTDKSIEKITDVRIRNIFNDYLEEISQGKNPNLYQLQIKHGYTPSSAKGYAVARTSTWKSLLDEIEDKPLIQRLEQIAFAGKDNDSISAIREIFKVKGRYPKSGLGSFDKDIYDLIEVEDATS